MTETPREEAIRVPGRWDESQAPTFVFADQLFARYVGSAYLVTFGLAHGPYEAQLSRERLEKEGVTISPVARVAISPAALGRFLKILGGLYERMSAQAQEQTDGGE